MKDIFDQTPQHDPRAERGLCACCVLDISTVGEVGRIITADDFHLGDCRDIWKVMSEAYEVGESIDVILLRSRLKANGSGVDDATLYEIASSEIVPYMAGKYAEIIADKAARRRLAAGAADVMRMSFDKTTPVADVLGACERLATDDDRDTGGSIDNATGLQATIAEIDSATGSAIPTGFSGIDAAYGGFFPGELVILAGKPSSGKSAAALQICEHVAKTEPVLLTSLEMDCSEVHRRRLARWSGVDLATLRRGALSAEQRQAVGDAAERLKSARLHILDAANCGLPEIAREARRIKHRENLGLIVVDYLQLLRADAGDSKSNRERQVAGLTRGLKCLARDLGIPVVVLSQLNRLTGDDEPRLSNLRESGAIEQDADIVAFVHRVAFQDTEKTKLIVAKHRNGRPQSFPLTFDGPRFQFVESEWGGGIETDMSDYTGFPASDPDGFGPVSFMDKTAVD
jgi:replicative DNA helicase